MKLWAVFWPGDGGIMVACPSPFKARANSVRIAWQWNKDLDWPAMFKLGYRCRRITVTVEGES